MTDEGIYYLQFETILKRIEGIIDDRPLTKLNENPLDIIISPTISIPGRKTTPTEIQNIDVSIKNFTSKRLKFQEIIYDTFWNIFYKDNAIFLSVF